MKNASNATTAAGYGAPVQPGCTPARRRVDAVQNRDRLLDAAEAVFLAGGTNVALDVVAARAGVGRATLFRNFPDRHALIVGLLERTLEELEMEAARVDADPGALQRLLRWAAERMVSRAPLHEYWRAAAHDSPDLQAAIQRFVAAFERPIAWAIAQGRCRQDLVPADILLFVSMLSGVLHGRTTAEKRLLADRAWTFIEASAQLSSRPAHK